MNNFGAGGGYQARSQDLFQEGEGQGDSLKGPIKIASKGPMKIKNKRKKNIHFKEYTFAIANIRVTICDQLNVDNPLIW